MGFCTNWPRSAWLVWRLDGWAMWGCPRMNLPARLGWVGPPAQWVGLSILGWLGQWVPYSNWMIFLWLFLLDCNDCHGRLWAQVSKRSEDFCFLLAFLWLFTDTFHLPDWGVTPRPCHPGCHRKKEPEERKINGSQVWSNHREKMDLTKYQVQHIRESKEYLGKRAAKWFNHLINASPHSGHSHQIMRVPFTLSSRLVTCWTD